jgi:hypothetical protein
MSFVDKTSTALAMPSDLEFFADKATDITIQSIYEEKHHPISLFQVYSGDIVFEITADTEDYFRPKDTCLSFGLSIERSDGAAINEAERVAFENNAAHTVFGELHAELGKQTVVGDMLYPYTSYKKAITNYSADANNSHRTSALFYKDTAGHMDALLFNEDNILTATRAAAAQYMVEHPLVVEGADQNAIDRNREIQHANAAIVGRKRTMESLNNGLQKRSKDTAQSRQVWVRMFPESDFFKIDKFIPSGVDLKVKFVRSKPEFCLHAHQAADQAQRISYRVHIHNPVLWITKAKILPQVYTGQNQTLDVKPAKYFLNRDVTKPITIPSGTTQFTMDNVTVGQLPKRLFFGFVTQAAYDGSYTANPFNFVNLQLQRAAVFIHGVSFPAVPFTPTYANENADYGREYDSLFSALGINHGNRGIEITRDDYPNGYCIYGFDLTPNASAADTSVMSLKKKGNTRIEFQLGAATTVVHYCIVFTEYDHVLKIDGDRNVYVSYGL